MGGSLKKSEVYRSWKNLRLLKKFIFFAVLYGLSSLIIPLTTQYLVNTLALSGIFSNTLTFLLILMSALLMAQLFRYCQVILSEYLQREIFYNEVNDWRKANVNKQAPYFFEIFALMKSFSSSFSQVIEMVLLVIFGLLLIVSFHPVFLVLIVLIAIGIWLILSTWHPAIEASLEESGHKYWMYDQTSTGKELNESDVEKYLLLRDRHFKFIKKNKITVGMLVVISQLVFIGLGIYLIELNQLSIGQFVSAEITLGGILSSMTKFPKSLESLYNYETSKIKLKYAMKEEHA